MKETDLTGIVAEHIDAINAADTDRAVAPFAKDAYVNDNHREFVGIDAIRRWVAKEMVGDKVTIEVREVLDHYGDTVVRGAAQAPRGPRSDRANHRHHPPDRPASEQPAPHHRH